MERQAAAVLFTAVDKAEKKEKRICLCGNLSPHAKRTDCIVGRPGTPWWDAFHDAEKGEEVTVELPGRIVRLKVKAIEPLAAENAA